jgi:anti-anti-sigma factor
MSQELFVAVRQREGNYAVVQVSGDMDVDSCPPVEQALADLADSGTLHLVLDMSAVGFCDSSGINALLRALAHAKERHGSLSLAATAPQVQRVLDLLGMGAVITSYPSVAAALERTGT